MKIGDKLDEIFSQGPKIKILRFLFTDKDEHTGRGIAKATNISVSYTHKMLQDMKESGIINARKKGNAILYKIRENNHFVKKLLAPLFEKEKTIFGDIVGAIKKTLLKIKKDVITIALFGSVASRKETLRSDIDIVIIVNDKMAKKKANNIIDTLTIDMAQKYGVALSPYILTKSEIRSKYTKKVPIIQSILNNNKLIYGEPIERVIT